MYMYIYIYYMYGMVWLKKAVNLFGLFDDVLNFLVSEATYLDFFDLFLYTCTCTMVYVHVYTCVYAVGST